jgi:hypothetical protein
MRFLLSVVAPIAVDFMDTVANSKGPLEDLTNPVTSPAQTGNPKIKMEKTDSINRII